MELEFGFRVQIVFQAGSGGELEGYLGAEMEIRLVGFHQPVLVCHSVHSQTQYNHHLLYTTNIYNVNVQQTK
jgi:hypothetical protein